ncbi:hypothetical protein NE236_26575 [Actinoallomurus purpureus]|uniref:hypothetical protein n=1 Tax=Actinoallomurus purpureus TaxID=478114 RepID=UPI002093EC5A|nr:hypothetical protein [Actinoallomurus purpureus]MCO6008543.1 hypothetical protein [Actinoallomurus purpureus]
MAQAPPADQMTMPIGTERPIRWSAKALRSGWVPTALVIAVAVALLRYYGVPLRETAFFGTFITLGSTVPGVLLWRAFRGGSQFVAEEVAAGTVLGQAITVLIYVGARWAGHPLFVLAWPVATVTAFLAVPALRRHWRRTDPVRHVPAAYSWALAALVGFVVLSTGSAFYRQHGLAWPGYAAPYIDMPYHLGLIGELKHHMPPQWPSVAGEPLYYHWFVYADMAATSWVTGIEPQTLLYRLFMLPTLATSLVLLFAAARRLTDRWWPGMVALAINCLVWAPSVYSWYPSLGVDFLIRADVPWRSPTQGLGAMMFAPVILLLIDLLRRPRSGAGPWILFVTLLMGVMGAKATYLPMLIAGLLIVLIGTIIASRRLHRPALVALLAAAPSVLIAKVVLFGGNSDGVIFHPGSMFGAVADVAASTSDPPQALRAVAALVSIVGRVFVWGGALCLALRRRTLCDPAILLLLGISVTGIAVACILRFAGNSQSYFLCGVMPCMSLVSVYGLMAVLPGRLGRRSGIMLLGASAGGVAAVLAVRGLGGNTRPTVGDALPRMLGPFFALIVISIGCMVLLVLAGRRRPSVRSLSPVVALAFVGGLILPGSLLHVRQLWHGIPRDPLAAVIGAGTLEAGRWLREHSRPDDLVATNAVCLSGMGCDDRRFAVSAYSERRVLVESWRYTARAHMEGVRRHIADESVPFWDLRRLMDNEAVFHRPSPEAVRRLRHTYGVRWLFVDRGFDRPAPDLDRFARLRYAAGQCRVYEITR